MDFLGSLFTTAIVNCAKWLHPVLTQTKKERKKKRKEREISDKLENKKNDLDYKGKYINHNLLAYLEEACHG